MLQIVYRDVPVQVVKTVQKPVKQIQKNVRSTSSLHMRAQCRACPALIVSRAPGHALQIVYKDVPVPVTKIVEREVVEVRERVVEQQVQVVVKKPRVVTRTEYVDKVRVPTFPDPQAATASARGQAALAGRG